MRAFRLLDWMAPPQLVETAVPEPGAGEVRVKVAGTGLCHSDITMSQLPREVGDYLGWQMPFTLGHEVGGWVDAVGPGVEGWAEGDAVVLVSAYSCGVCTFCLRGNESACSDSLTGRGYGRDGGLADYVVARADRELVRLESLDPAIAGVLTDAGATSYHGVKRVLGALGPDQTVVVIGVGGLGSYAVQFLAALSPARIVAVDSHEGRLAASVGFGAHETLAGVDESTGAALRSLVGGDGAAAVLDFVGVDATIECAATVLAPMGMLGVVGAGGGRLVRGIYGGLPRDASLFTYQGSSISDVREVVGLAESGDVRVTVETFTLADVDAAYAALGAGTLASRAVVQP